MTRRVGVIDVTGHGRGVYLFVVALVLGTLGFGSPSQANSLDPAPTDPRVPTTNIISGEDIPITDAPWQVGLLTVSWGLAQFCGGSIIDAQWVVTAAHCVSGISWMRSADDLKILAGVADLTTTPKPAYEVELILRHPDYDPTTYTNDVALIKLARPLPLNGTTMAPIALPVEDPAAWPAMGTPAFISGWGNTSTTERKYPDILQGAFVEIMASPTGTHCGNYPFDEYLPREMLCAGTIVDPLTDTCQGDSGGPLAIDVAGTWTLAGITSWGEGCAQPGYPGVYTRVTTYTPWIARTTATDWAVVAGTVDSSSGPLDMGRVEFYATCEDWSARTATATTTVNRSYQVTVPAGGYLVRIVPDPGQRALRSWHSAATSCVGATVVNVSPGPNVKALRALPATKVTGQVYDENNRRITSGSMEFYPTCQDWEQGKATAQTILDGAYEVSLPAGDYRVRIVNRDSESAIVTSWNHAKPNCQSADPVSVPAAAEDYPLRLVGLSVAPAPQPTPTPTVTPEPLPKPTPTPVIKTDQTVEQPPAKAKQSKRVVLAARTKQNLKVTWSTRTAKICTVSKHTMRAVKKGTCKLVANAAGTATLNPLTRQFTVKVK